MIEAAELVAPADDGPGGPSKAGSTAYPIGVVAVAVSSRVIRDSAPTAAVQAAARVLGVEECSAGSASRVSGMSQVTESAVASGARCQPTKVCTEACTPTLVTSWMSMGTTPLVRLRRSAAGVSVIE